MEVSVTITFSQAVYNMVQGAADHEGTSVDRMIVEAVTDAARGLWSCVLDATFQEAMAVLRSSSATVTARVLAEKLLMSCGGFEHFVAKHPANIEQNALADELRGVRGLKV